MAGMSKDHRLYGELICHFASAKSTDDAGKVFLERAKKAFAQDEVPANMLDYYNNAPDDPFPTLESFNDDLDKNLSEVQKTIVRDFIDNHPSHLHYTTGLSKCTFRGLPSQYDIYYEREPVIIYSTEKWFEHQKGELKVYNCGMKGSQAKKQESEDKKGEWVDMDNIGKIHIGAFDRKIDRAISNYKLPEKEASTVHNVLHYYFDHLEPEHNHINRIQNELRNVLDVLAGTKRFDDAALSALTKFEEIHTDHNLHADYIVARDDGGIKIHNYIPFDGGFGFYRFDFGVIAESLEEYYDVAIAFCLFEFFRDENNQKYLKKCANCHKFFLRKTLRDEKTENRFCSPKCKRDFHNQLNIESGKHAEYKRKKRREGARESYYG